MAAPGPPDSDSEKGPGPGVVNAAEWEPFPARGPARGRRPAVRPPGRAQLEPNRETAAAGTRNCLLNQHPQPASGSWTPRTLDLLQQQRRRTPSKGSPGPGST